MPDRHSLHGSPHLVWVVEDSQLEAALAARVLTPEFRVVIFPDGASVVEALSTTRELPDVMLLDLVLPGVDGLEVCRIVRATYDELALPLLIVSGRSSQEMRLEALEAGVNDVLTKPFEPQEMRARVRVLARVRRTHQRAKELESSLELFVGTISHDLRTPLHAMSGYASMMLTREDLPEKHRQWADRIVTVGARMARMLDELVETTEVRGTGLHLDRRVTRLNDVVAAVVEEVQIAHPAAILQCRFEGENEGLWDPDRLARVIQNLTTNAITHGGSSEPVRVEVIEHGAHSVVTVHNGGNPIPETLRAALFDPFRHGRRRGGGGLGLGLYITRELVVAHGGDISFSSSAESGTTFSVTLPRGVAAPASSEPIAVA